MYVPTNGARTASISTRSINCQIGVVHLGLCSKWNNQHDEETDLFRGWQRLQLLSKGSRLEGSREEESNF